MTKILEHHNVPSLRFSEFSEEWKIKKLGRLAPHISYGLTVRPAYIKNGIPLISAKEIKGGVIDYINAPQISQVSFDQLSKKAKAERGDIFLSKTGTIGRVAYFSLDMVIAITQNIAILRVDQEKYSHQYIVQYLKTKKFKKSALRKVNQSTIMDLQLQDIKKLTIFIPSKPEQQKIASFLTSVDTKIKQLGKKKALLEKYKKGMMQKIFNQEIRFKDEQGNDFPDWEKLPLGELYEFKPTNSFSRDKLNYENGDVYNIHYGDIHTKFKLRFILNQEHVPFINAGINIDRIPSERFCKEGDLIIADASEDYDDIGKTIELINLDEKKVLAGLHTLQARLLSDNIYIGYGAHMMTSESVRAQIKIIAQGTKVLGISIGRMNKVELPIPSKLEQQKIVNLLTALDQKIDFIITELKQAQSLKKGLLQQMFF